MFLPVRERGQLEGLFEDAMKMGEFFKARFKGNGHHGFVRLDQQVPGMDQAQFLEILLPTLVSNATEQLGELSATYPVACAVSSRVFWL